MIEAVAHRVLSTVLGKVAVGFVAVLTSVRYGAGLYFWRVTEQLERPVYDVVQRLPGNVEVRRYEPYLVAETSVVAAAGDDGKQNEDYRKSTGDGFRVCAGYIFGKNKSVEKMAMTAPVRSTVASVRDDDDGGGGGGEKMAMTAPVRVTGAGGGGGAGTKVSFVVGSKYTLKTAPKPVDANVKLRQIPSHTLAVRSFSGPPPMEKRIRKERAVLEKELEKKDLKPKNDETLVYGYHDPFLTPNFLRRNEVAVILEGNV